MSNEFKGKRVLVTGAARGIGYCTAAEFARAGATVVLTDRDAQGLADAAAKLRAEGAIVRERMVDVTDKAAVDALASWLLETLGPLDVLVNNAGVGHHGRLADMSIETWKTQVDVNLWGPLYHVYAFLPSMTAHRSGHIVNVSSGQAFFRLPTWGAYAAVKVALGAFSEVLHFEMRRHGVHVTTVYPFMVNTPFYAGVHGDTPGARLAMRLLPYYSMSPERVGRIVFDAVRHNETVEMVSIVNRLGYYAHLIPPLFSAMSWLTDRVLARGAEA